jgi:hypothetical protein
MVFKGTPTANSLVTCGPGAVGLRARAGKTYNIMVFSDTAVNGGRLVLTLKNAPTPRVHVSVAKRGVAFRGGAARVHGTYFCKHGEEFSVVSAHLFQRAGRLKIQGESGVNIRCNAKRHHWSARVVSPVGTYAAGRAVARVKIFACGLLECRQASARRHIRLAWASGSHRDEVMVHRPTTRTERPRPTIELQRHWPTG